MSDSTALRHGDETSPSMDDFFNSRPILSHIHDTAHALIASPWATLGVVLARAAASTPPEVQLPAITGGPQSLNLFVNIVGVSGRGKGAAEAAGNASVQFVTHSGESPRIIELPVGSGEGIARTFRPHGTKADEPNPETAALFSVAEVDTIAAIGKRQGSTILSQLRSVYSGERLGFANAGTETRIIVAPHTYRACLVVGVQPSRAGAILDDVNGGTPQRFIWMDAEDPSIPDDLPACPAPLTVKAPAWASGTTHLQVADRVRAEIRARRIAVVRGDSGVDPLDGHRDLTRLKVAAALMLLESRSVVSDDDWKLAGTVMSVSRSTREMCRREIADNARRATSAKAHAAEVGEKTKERLRIDDAVDYVLRMIERRGGECTGRDLSQGTKRLRDYLPAATEELIARDTIATEEIPGGGKRFTLTNRPTDQHDQHRKSQVEALGINSVGRSVTTKPQVRSVGRVGRVGRPEPKANPHASDCGCLDCRFAS